MSGPAPSACPTAAAPGREAWLQWQHPQRGLLPPARFIPLAKELGLITSSGQPAGTKLAVPATCPMEPLNARLPGRYLVDKALPTSRDVMSTIWIIRS